MTPAPKPRRISREERAARVIENKLLGDPALVLSKAEIGALRLAVQVLRGEVKREAKR